MRRTGRARVIDGYENEVEGKREVEREKGKVISRSHRETMCRSQERNTIGGNIDLPWELPCATSWQFFAQATSRFFFQDNTMSRATPLLPRLAVFPPLLTMIYHIADRLWKFHLSFYALRKSLNAFGYSWYEPSCHFILFPTFFTIFFQCRQVSFDTHLGEKDNGPHSQESIIYLFYSSTFLPCEKEKWMKKYTYSSFK